MIFLEEALKLAELGYHVFQCVPNGKMPFYATAPNGCNSATDDPKTVTKWWTQYPDCNIGVKCENLLVLDLEADEVETDHVTKNERPKRSGGFVSGLDAAIIVLREAGEPLNIKTIMQRIDERGLAKLSGKTPSATVSSAIQREIGRKGAESRLYKVGKGMFSDS